MTKTIKAKLNSVRQDKQYYIAAAAGLLSVATVVTATVNSFK